MPGMCHKTPSKLHCKKNDAYSRWVLLPMFVPLYVTLGSENEGGGYRDTSLRGLLKVPGAKILCIKKHFSRATICINTFHHAV